MGRVATGQDKERGRAPEDGKGRPNLRRKACLSNKKRTACVRMRFCGLPGWAGGTGQEKERVRAM